MLEMRKALFAHCWCKKSEFVETVIGITKHKMQHYMPFIRMVTAFSECSINTVQVRLLKCAKHFLKQIINKYSIQIIFREEY